MALMRSGIDRVDVEYWWILVDMEPTYNGIHIDQRFDRQDRVVVVEESSLHFCLGQAFLIVRRWFCLQ